MSETVVHIVGDCCIKKDDFIIKDETYVKENYIDHIFKHRKRGSLVRVVASDFINWDGFYIIYEQNEGTKVLSIIDFDTLFEPVGKAKYTKAQLDKLRFIVEE